MCNILIDTNKNEKSEKSILRKMQGKVMEKYKIYNNAIKKYQKLI